MSVLISAYASTETGAGRCQNSVDTRMVKEVRQQCAHFSSIAMHELRRKYPIRISRAFQLHLKTHTHSKVSSVAGTRFLQFDFANHSGAGIDFFKPYSGPPKNTSFQHTTEKR